MSVFKRKGSPFYQFNSWLKGHRVRGVAETTNRREAEKIEEAAREAKRKELRQPATEHPALRCSSTR